MKKFFTSLLVLSSFQAFSYVNHQQFSDKEIYDISVDTLSVAPREINGAVYAVPTLHGVKNLAAVHYEQGSVEVPVVRFEVFANSASDIQITERIQKSALTLSAKNLKPSFASVVKRPGADYAAPKTLKFPSLKPFSIKEVGSVRGVKKFLVTLAPVVVNETGLSVERSFTVEVKRVQAPKAASGVVFLVGEKFKGSAALAKYVSHKMSKGLEVHQIDVAAGMKAEDIRIALKALYTKKKNLKYVIIVGDAEDVPGYEGRIHGTTDHYYAAIDTPVYEKDVLSPDLQVGRVSARDEKELAGIFNKYTIYAQGNFTNASWTQRLSFIATDDRWQVAEGSHNYVIDTYTKGRSYAGSFPAANQVGGDKLYAITHKADTEDLLAAMQLGRGIIDYSGHGGSTYWVGPHFDQEDVRSLKHSSYPFVMSNACDTGAFTTDESFSETWQRHPQGAIVFWGSMDSTYWDEDDILEKRLFDGIFKGGLRTFGDITEFGLKEVSRHYNGQNRSAYYFETYHIFGDPSISLRL